MILYHFTSRHHLPMIRLTGELSCTESNIGSPSRIQPPFGEHVGPDVVWLTSSPEPEGHGLEGAKAVSGYGTAGDDVDKSEIRITVEIPDSDAEHWPEFAVAHGIHPEWRRALEKGHRAESWYVCRRPIPRSEWRAVENLRTGLDLMKDRPPLILPPAHGTEGGHP